MTIGLSAILLVAALLDGVVFSIKYQDYNSNSAPITNPYFDIRSSASGVRH